MKARPILMNAAMVQATLEGRKTQTRRIVKPQPPEGFDEHIHYQVQNNIAVGFAPRICPYGKIGDLLYVRETLCSDGENDWLYSVGSEYVDEEYPEEWRKRNAHRMSIPSIHMPKWASRITLEITDIRVERLIDISYDDCIAEGCTGCQALYYSPHDEFFELWRSINGQASLDANPWLWAIEFEVHKCNFEDFKKEV